MFKDLEIEKKYVIPDEETLWRIRNDVIHRAIPGVRIEKVGGPAIRFDVYYDTADNLLLESGMSFRMGLKSDREARLTFKAPTGRLHTRREIEDFLPPAEAELCLAGKLRSRATDALREVVGPEAKILPRLKVAKYFWGFEGRGWECVYGFILYAGFRGALERLDLEVEAKREKTARIERIGDALKRRYGLKEDPRSKYEVGMREVG